MYFGCKTRTNTYLWVILCIFGTAGIVMLGMGKVINRREKQSCENCKEHFSNCSTHCDEDNLGYWIGLAFLVIAVIPIPIMFFCVDENTKSCFDSGLVMRVKKQVRLPDGQVVTVEEDVNIEPQQAYGFGTQQTNMQTIPQGTLDAIGTEQTTPYGTQVAIDTQQTTLYSKYPYLYTDTLV